jgi:predicted TIM-barrel fold metal-dependent hydrolase
LIGAAGVDAGGDPGPGHPGDLGVGGADRVLFSTDYPFHQPNAAAVEQFFAALADPTDRTKIASGNAGALFRLDLA